MVPNVSNSPKASSFTLKGTNISPIGKRKNHLHNWLLMGHVSSKEGYSLSNHLFFLDGEGTPWLAAFWLALVCATTVPSRHPTGRIPSQQDPPGSLGWGVGGENGVVKMGGATHRGSMQSVGVSVFFSNSLMPMDFEGWGVIQNLNYSGSPSSLNKSKVWRRVSDFHPESVAELVVSGNIAFCMMGSVPFGPVLVKARG